MSEDEVIEWLRTRSSRSVQRVIEAGGAILAERMADMVMDS